MGLEKLALLFENILLAMNNSKFNDLIFSTKVLIYKDLGQSLKNKSDSGNYTIFLVPLSRILSKFAPLFIPIFRK